MREIEVKAKLTDKKGTIEKLKSLGCVFSKPVTQEDTVYVEKMGSLETFLSNTAFLRIRVKDGVKIIFTVKRRTGALQAIEHEVEVSSKSELEGMLSLMGYTVAVVVNKVRITTEYNGCEICIDEVKDLGTFIEMEKMVEEGDFEQIQKELFTFLMSVGIAEKDRAFAGYDILMLQKKGV